jgi:hypothetical protein
MFGCIFYYNQKTGFFRLTIADEIKEDSKEAISASLRF